MTDFRLGLVALVFAVGCAAHAPSQPRPEQRQRDLLTREEILNSAQGNLDLFQVIRSLRPQFMARSPGVARASSPTTVAVYVGRIRQNDLDALRTIQASSVQEVRYLDPTQSQNEFGAAASAGALVVTLYKPAPPKDPSAEP